MSGTDTINVGPVRNSEKVELPDPTKKAGLIRTIRRILEDNFSEFLAGPALIDP